MRNFDRRTFGGLVLASLTSQAAAAAAITDFDAPLGKPILTVTGHISRKNTAESAVFDRDMLERLGVESFETSTPWYSGEVKFEGVPMSRLMQAVGAIGKNVEAVALNDYTTELPMADFDKYGVLLALKRDGAYMPVRDKGPLFIVYPYDKQAELKSHQFYSRSAWQVAKLIVKE